MRPLRIFIGYDPVEAVAYHTLCHSILSRASVPVAITPINLMNLRGIYSRQRDPHQSNEFSFTRFLVPYLAGYEGWALFMDCDMLVTTDIKELFDLAEEDKAVMVVKHDYTPCSTEKYLGTKQYPYPRKNWSSVVLWNCGHPANRVVDPGFVNTAPALDLHRFRWLVDESIGELPVEWNWLVGEYPYGYKGIQEADVKNFHYTIGGPYFHEYEHVDGAEKWFNERSTMTFCAQKK